MPKHTEIFDVDGTLTYGFGDIGDTTGLTSYDLWFCISRELAQDEVKFDGEVRQWKEDMRGGKDTLIASRDMMQLAIDYFPKGTTAEQVLAVAERICQRFVKCGVIRLSAIQYLKDKLKRGHACVLSTANYVEGAQGLLNVLVKSDILTADEASKLLITGSEVDWSARKVTHINVRENKLLSLERALSQSVAEFKHSVYYVFGDDPIVNDVAILELATRQAYVIRTKKNADLAFPDQFALSTWDEINKLVKPDKPGCCTIT